MTFSELTVGDFFHPVGTSAKQIWQKSEHLSTRVSDWALFLFRGDTPVELVEPSGVAAQAKGGGAS